MIDERLEDGVARGHVDHEPEAGDDQRPHGHPLPAHERERRYRRGEYERGELVGAPGERIADERELTVVFTEHDMQVVFAVADRISVLHQGRIIAYGTPEEIQHHSDPVVQSFIKGEVDFLEG